MKLFLFILIFLHLAVANAFNIDSLKKEAFVPPVDKDWILLKSNEIVRGKIISLYQEDIEFDSDDLDSIIIDWSSVQIIRSAESMSVRLNDGRIVKGRLIVNGNDIHLVAPDGKTTTYPRSELNTIVNTSKGEVGLWNGEFMFGFDLKDGNTQQMDFLISTDLRRLAASSRIKINYLTQLSKASREQTANNHRLNSTYDHFYSQRVFLRPADFEYFKDKFQNIKSRVTYGISVGYQILDTPKHDWEMSIGPSIQQTTYVDVSEENKSRETSPVAQLSTVYEYAVTKNIDFELSYRIQAVNPKLGSKLHNFNSGFDIELIDNFDINIIAILDRVEKPIATSEGAVPEKNDYTLSLGISYEL